jgi:organic hydroperoxide reductase OsmC/OhrA
MTCQRVEADDAVGDGHLDTNSDGDVVVAQDLSSRAGDETSSKKENLPDQQLACGHSGCELGASIYLLGASENR